MMATYRGEQGRLERADFDEARLGEVVWIDLMQPIEEDAQVDRLADISAVVPFFYFRWLRWL